MSVELNSMNLVPAGSTVEPVTEQEFKPSSILMLCPSSDSLQYIMFFYFSVAIVTLR